LARRIGELEPRMTALSDEELREQTARLPTVSRRANSRGHPGRGLRRLPRGWPPIP
jgi:hypothetical protein